MRTILPTEFCGFDEKPGYQKIARLQEGFNKAKTIYIWRDFQGRAELIALVRHEIHAFIRVRQSA